MPQDTPWTDTTARAALRALFDTAVAAADPRAVLARHLPPKPASGRCIVVGGGKSAAVMAAALEDAWPDVPLEGTVVTRYGHAVPTRRIEVIEASHPVPDANSERGARRLLERVRGLGVDDLVIALMSGGASALLAAPAAGLTLADKQAVNRALLACGATISEMNTVRKHLSAIKGGRLAAAAAPARVVTLAISDVPGDDPGVIGSGPTVPDATTFAEARALVARHGITLSPQVAARLARDDDETPKPGSLPHTEFRMIATPMMALYAMAAKARELGLAPLILGDALEGEASQMGIVMAGIARSVRAHGHPLRPPAVLLSGGETTVTMSAAAPGKGGRNTTFLLGLAIALDGAPGIWATAGDTDGIDGMDEIAGALMTPDTLRRARENGLDARACLAAHDSHGFFGAVGDLIVTGPTLTNVNDIRAIIVS
ncbi:glycerate kinase type-2 family protein [Rhodopila globiformis]|uniref:Glycerate kinase n=1 Tax=Rhodopila globiformis TaxID=1071 RepID=A0A2S6NNC7_RHOGL|nr:glycerate kinase [Rhodopila globiformis]PPQ38497.1 glycerate kinase [Rhodopila globiformis]